MVPGGSDSDIADMWAEQRRIRLREAIQADKRKAGNAGRRKAFFKRLTHPKPGAVAKGGEGVVLELKLPRLGRSRLLQAWRRISVKWRVAATGIAVALLVLAVVLPGVGRDAAPGGTTTAKDKGGTTGVLGTKDDTPSYPTLLPEGKTIQQLGGWGRISPPDKDPVYAFADRINGVNITVSQQPLPEDFKADTPASLAQLAHQFSANEELSVNGTTAYLGTSIKGPQSVLLTEYGLLILIKSDSKIPNDQWVEYIYSLRQS
jgi:hypothetical protein